MITLPRTPSHSTAGFSCPYATTDYGVRSLRVASCCLNVQPHGLGAHRQSNRECRNTVVRRCESGPRSLVPRPIWYPPDRDGSTDSVPDCARPRCRRGSHRILRIRAGVQVSRMLGADDSAARASASRALCSQVDPRQMRSGTTLRTRPPRRSLPAGFVPPSQPAIAISSRSRAKAVASCVTTTSR